jgi:SNF2 family DNA or RNA helicase
MEPPTVHFKLSPEQARTATWMASRESGGAGDVNGGILADDVGSGKSFAVLGLLLEAPLWPTLIVVPKSLVYQWTRLLSAAGVRDVCAVTSRSASSVGRAASCEHVVLATLGSIVGTGASGDPPAELAGRIWGRVVIDEAHCAKNPRSRTHRVLRSLYAHSRWAVTATPVQNHAGDLIAMARLIGVATDDAAFARSFVRAKHDVDLEGEALSPGVQRSPQFVLPALDVRTVHVALDRPGEAELYATVAGRIGEAVVDDDVDVPDAAVADEHEEEEEEEPSKGSSSSRDFERMLRCRLAATHPALYHRSMSRKMRGSTEADRMNASKLADAAAASPAHEVSSKLAFLSAELSRSCSDDGEKEKTVVFCDWLEEMRLVEAEIVRSGSVESAFSVHLFHGGLSVEERDEVLAAFAADGDAGSVLIAQIRCAGAGLNLQCASRAFLMRPQWNPSVEQQAIGRLHRIGQRRPVTVFRLVAADTVDDTCLKRQRSKLACIRQLMHTHPADLQTVIAGVKNLSLECPTDPTDPKAHAHGQVLPRKITSET